MNAQPITKLASSPTPAVPGPKNRQQEDLHRFDRNAGQRAHRKAADQNGNLAGNQLAKTAER